MDRSEKNTTSLIWSRMSTILIRIAVNAPVWKPSLNTNNNWNSFRQLAQWKFLLLTFVDGYLKIVAGHQFVVTLTD